MRLSRLLNMVMILLRQETVSASELATQFEVTTRTIYRDVDALNLAGIPIYTTRGRNGGIGILPNYKVDKKLLTESDIGNLLVALGGVQSLIDTPAIRATVQKIQAMYQPEQRTALSVQHADWTGSEELKALAEQFSQAIQAHQLVSFTYSDRTGQGSTRQIEPYRLTYKGERWYIQGYSLERAAFRTFRLSRIKTVTFLATTFDPRPLPEEQLSWGGFDHPVMTEITLIADNVVRDVIVERFGRQAIRDETAERFTATLELPQREATYRFLLSLGVHARVTGNDPFLVAFKQYTAMILTQYQ